MCVNCTRGEYHPDPFSVRDPAEQTMCKPCPTGMTTIYQASHNMSQCVSKYLSTTQIPSHQPGMYVAWDRIYADRLRHLSNMETMDWKDTLTALFYCPQQNSVTADTSWTWRRTCARSVPTPSTARRTHSGRSSVSPAQSPRTRHEGLYRLNWASTSLSAPSVSNPRLTMLYRINSASLSPSAPSVSNPRLATLNCLNWGSMSPSAPSVSNPRPT